MTKAHAREVPDAKDRDRSDVRVDGELLVCEPAESLPMAQRYFLF